MNTMLKATFPYFGGKSHVAAEVWSRFGDVPNYVEPFCGSCAMLLARPTEPRIETINDKDGMVANFWRAVAAQPDAVAEYADWPVNENDLHARHVWLVSQKDSLQARLEGDPEYYDAKIAGWWCWGMCCWIGGEFCSGKGPWQAVDGQLVHLGNAGRGVNRKLVHLGDAGKGVNRRRVDLGGGKGVNRTRVYLRRGQGVNKKNGRLIEWFDALRDRLRYVRVCCGGWSRVCGPSVTFLNGTTAVFLDPPYSGEAGRANAIYTYEDLSIAHHVRQWALANGDNPHMRIALCGYDGEHDMPASWDCLVWTASGGYAVRPPRYAPNSKHYGRVSDDTTYLSSL